ncbi:Polyadenylate-binding protein-interacting protein 7 [Colletotrichum sp. SAR 10_70]|nr:Polyadenylate-binding protein-interacting protein 7 [Colletotrichum sp. SAR 10_70]KAI8218564.1 Polyadenylate-binding protein-interacting protein 7 [Colletotrichum sp. SAR 10_86]KAI8301443.1 Polyadenylate-binding protein-interacting protein 7 [Colletotrichum sp. SAR11_240]
MVSDEHYEICLPILQDATLEDEDKTDQLEDLLRSQTSLSGPSLDNAILDVLWRYRDGGGSSTSPPPIRQTILRRPSPPNLNAYEFANDRSPSQETFGDYQTENVEWLVADDAISITSSVGTSSGLNAAAPEFSSMSSQQADMSPYDMLRSILGQTRTDDEIEAALALHGHDLSNHLCKYWVMGNCLAGETCIFSHDPAHLMNKLALDGSSTPPTKQANNLDLNSFPALPPGTPEHLGGFAGGVNITVGITPPPGLKPFYQDQSPRPRSRPGSRHQQAREPVAPSLDDADAFPTLGSAAAKQGKKHHGKRGGHGHNHKENFGPSSLAEIVKMSPSPSSASLRQDTKKLGRNGSSTNIRNGENSAAAQAIPNPKHIPWLETGERANKAYLKARQEAIKHGGLRNKFLQSAAQAWNRNDARAAKALSLRGQSENDLMRKAHREAARELYEERNKGNANSLEIYVDLHGLHPEEAVEYLERVLMENVKESRSIYAITGTGHHSKNGKDKVGKAIRNFLNEWRYAYREFSVPGDRNNMGGILGIDARSYDKSLAREGTSSADESKEEVDILSQGVEIGDGKVRLLVRDPPKGPSGRR